MLAGAAVTTLSTEAAVAGAACVGGSPSDVQPNSASMSAMDCSIFARVKSSKATGCISASLLPPAGASADDAVCSDEITAAFMSAADEGLVDMRCVAEPR